MGGGQARDRRGRDAGGRGDRVLLADDDRRRRRRQLRAVPDPPAVPLLRDLRAPSTAFNADYYGAIIRAYYDGKMPWLNDVEHGETYKAGDLYGSLGAWFAGRWHTQGANDYIARVKETWPTDLADRRLRNTRGL